MTTKEGFESRCFLWWRKFETKSPPNISGVHELKVYALSHKSNDSSADVFGKAYRFYRNRLHIRITQINIENSENIINN